MKLSIKSCGISKLCRIKLVLFLTIYINIANADVIPDFTDAPFSQRDMINSRVITIDDTFYIGMSGGKIRGLFSYTQQDDWKKIFQSSMSIDDNNGHLIIRHKSNASQLIDGKFKIPNIIKA